MKTPPVPTPLIHSAKGPVFAYNLVHTFEKLHAETRTHVKWDVTMHEPGARVVGLEGKDEVAFRWKGGGVATDWVVGFQKRCIAGPLGVLRLGEDVEVVTVQVDGMWEGRSCGVSVLLDHPVLPLLWLSVSTRRDTTYALEMKG